jgi:hypothetical protein
MTTTRVLHRFAPPALVAIALACVALPAYAAPIIDFESLAVDEVVTTQFAPDGALFGNAVTLVSGVSLNEIDFPPSSGTNVISGLGSGALGIGIITAAVEVSFQLTTADIAVVSYYDSASALIGQTQVAPNLGSHTLVQLHAAGAPIAGVRIASLATGDAFFLTVDDVQVTVPEPSAFLALAVGLLPVAAAIRRHRA